MASPDEFADWQGAVILLDDGSARPAAFVWANPGGGVTWVEPSYADPAGAASPALHTRESGAEALPYEAKTDRVLVGDALEWFRGWLEAEGKTWAEERDRLAIEIGLA